MKRKTGKKRAAKKSKGTDPWEHGATRPPVARVMKIHAKIAAGEYPNAETLRVEFEMSERTVKRDIAFMKDRMELPMVFDRRKNGYYYREPVKNFPGIPLSEKDVVGLFVVQQTMAQYQGTSLQPILEASFQKITSGLDDEVRYTLGDLDHVMSIRPHAPGETNIEVFELLTRAISEQRAVKFVYRKHGQTVTGERKVHPYHVAYVNNQWTLFAWDPAARDIRKYVLIRITTPEILSEKFTVTHAFDLNRELSGSMGVYKGKADFEVVIDFDAWGADDVRGRRWHASQELTELPKGHLRVRLRLNSLEEVQGWVLSFGVHARVVRPQELIDRIQKVAAGMREIYTEG